MFLFSTGVCFEFLTTFLCAMEFGREGSICFYLAA